VSLRFAPVVLSLAVLVAVASSDAQADPPGIQDNSFLLEESYNQDPHVVQHINSFARSFDTKSWAYTFTQEWPVPGLTHQLSYTVPVVGSPGESGFGDVLLNYRYQLVGDADAKLAISPRFSLSLPTGDAARGLGLGALGYQVDIPMSVVISRRLVTHTNLGATVTPSAHGPGSARATVTAYNLGQSLVWLAHPRFNALVEVFFLSASSVAGPGATERSHVLQVSPGVRWAYNFESGLQIVPGIAVPIGVGSHHDTSLFVYLSFEHPFGKTAR